MTLTPAAEDWRRRGRAEEFRGRRIHAWVRAGGDPVLLFLHGFPSSSYDWRLLLEAEPERAAIAFDFLGFGLSEKPRDHDYSLLWQADLAEELVSRHAAGRPVFVVAHDMGTSVANELMARDLEGALGFELRGVLLLNGSMVQSAATPTLAQRILRSRAGPLFAQLSGFRFFRAQFGSVFSDAHPLTDEEAADQWSLICAGGGRTLNHKLVGYMGERELRAARWHGALRDWRGPLAIAWGMRDPVATEAVLDAVLALRPAAPLERFEDLGHYPQLEGPERVAGALRRALSAA